jgi:hypothetical protein
MRLAEGVNVYPGHARGPVVAELVRERSDTPGKLRARVDRLRSNQARVAPLPDTHPAREESATNEICGVESRLTG